MRIKKEEESLNSSTSLGATGGTHSMHHHNTNYLPDISENLRTIQVEVRSSFPKSPTQKRQILK
jgi:hypothetical protein